MTKVVNIYTAPHDIYVGRPGRGVPGYFGNPHFITKTNGQPCSCGQPHTLPEVLNLFMKYFMNRIEQDDEFRGRVLELKDQTLGCFCRPKEGFQGRLLCHGQIIAGWLDGIPPEQVA